jgi:2-C-methyl-D-erythritol 4-phosphate cytidylyltransferase
MPDTSDAVIVAAGISSRMQGRDKLWLPLAGRLTLARTIDAFEACPCVDRLALVTRGERLAEAATLCREEAWRKVSAIVPGGERRQDSVRAGLDALSRLDPPPHWVTIHDGARPLVTPDIIAAGLAAAQEHGAATAAVPVKDTLKQAWQGAVSATPDRSLLWSVQTPQVFAFATIYQAHYSAAARMPAVDDASLLERLHRRVAIFPGAYSNIKITTLEDLLLIEALLQGVSS